MYLIVVVCGSRRAWPAHRDIPVVAGEPRIAALQTKRATIVAVDHAAALGAHDDAARGVQHQGGSPLNVVRIEANRVEPQVAPAHMATRLLRTRRCSVGSAAETEAAAH